MKKNTLIQLVLIYAGVNAFLAGFPYFIPRIIYLFSNMPASKSNTFTEGSYLYTEITRIVLGLLLVLKSASISDYIAERTGGDNSITIYTKPSQLFYILLIIVAMADIIAHLPFLLFNAMLLFGSVTADKKGTSGLDYATEQWLVNICHLTVPLFIIFLSHRITNYFTKDFEAGENEIVGKHETLTLDAENNN